MILQLEMLIILLQLLISIGQLINLYHIDFVLNV